MKTLRLILGDQLNLQHSWFQQKDDSIYYLMAEVRQETDYVKHHIQKVTAFFLAMRNFAEKLQQNGHQVRYYKISDIENLHDFEKVIQREIARLNITHFEYQLPDEFRLDEQLKSIVENIGIPSKAVDTEHFYTDRTELDRFFQGKKQLLM